MYMYNLIESPDSVSMGFGKKMKKMKADYRELRGMKFGGIFDIFKPEVKKKKPGDCTMDRLCAIRCRPGSRTPAEMNMLVDKCKRDYGMSFGKRRKTKKTKKIPKNIIKLCRKYKIKMTKKVGKRRVYKKLAVLKKQIRIRKLRR